MHGIGAAAARTLQDEIYAFKFLGAVRPPRRMRGAEPGWLLLLLSHGTRLTPSFATLGGVRGAGTGWRLLLLPY